jgi:uncharacterized protein with GYD domain
MATYIVLANLTDQGIHNIKEQPQRIRQLTQHFAQSGVKIIGAYLTLGAYDNVFVVEAPDDETAARTLLAVGMQGNARTVTLRAFTLDEEEKLVQGLP